MKIKAENTQKYEGEIDEAPRWLRWYVVPWYRRVLMSPLLIYLTVIVAIVLATEVDGLWQNILLIPSYVLLLHIASLANKRWYQDRIAESYFPDL